MLYAVWMHACMSKKGLKFWPQEEQHYECWLWINNHFNLLWAGVAEWDQWVIRVWHSKAMCCPCDYDNRGKQGDLVCGVMIKKQGPGGCRGVYRNDPRHPTLLSVTFWPLHGDDCSGEPCWNASSPPCWASAFPWPCLPVPVLPPAVRPLAHAAPPPPRDTRFITLSFHLLQGLFHWAQCVLDWALTARYRWPGSLYCCVNYCHFPQRNRLENHWRKSWTRFIYL